VIVPTFNRPDLLPHTLESIAAQTWRNLQVIVVNDAGTSAADAVAPFRARLDLVYLEHAENRGLAATRNTALRAARGEWIAYLDDDDRFLPRHVETMVNALTAAGARIGYADSIRVEVEPDGRGGFRERQRVPIRIPYDRARVILKSYLPVQSVVHARACLDLTGPFDDTLRHREDWDLWIRMCRHWDFLHVPEITSEYYWKVSGPSLSNDTAARFNEVRTHIFRKNPDLLGPCLDEWESRLGEQARTIRALEAELARLRDNPLVRAGKALRRVLRGGG
jgi:glycosyltransferase involved in cell wall biosynthesis